MNHFEVDNEEDENEITEEEYYIISNFFLKLNEQKTNNDGLDQILEALHRIGEKAIRDLRLAGFAQDLANVENLIKKITRIQLYKDVTISHMIKILPPDQLNKLNNGAERSRYRKRNIQINNNTTIPHVEITDPLPNPWLRVAHVNKTAAHPAQRQQESFSSRNTEQQQKQSSFSRNIEEQQQGIVMRNSGQHQEQSTDSKDIKQQEPSISTNTGPQQNQAVAIVPANTDICSVLMQHHKAPEAIKPVVILG